MQKKGANSASERKKRTIEGGKMTMLSVLGDRRTERGSDAMSSECKESGREGGSDRCVC